MKLGKSYFADVEDSQMVLFNIAQDHNLDLVCFTEYYLNSKIREMIDDGAAYYATMLGTELYDLLNVSDVKRTEIPERSFVAEWFGAFYAAAVTKLGVSSKYVCKLVPPEKLLRKYNALHDLDMDIAIQKVFGASVVFTDNFVFFHNPNEENGFLSNWHHSIFTIGKQQYTSAEQYMMHSKALKFNDHSTAELVLQTSNVAEIKQLGRSVVPYIDSVWAKCRYNVMVDGLYEKFIQNPTLTSSLLYTGDKILAECAVRDQIWGIGLSMNDPKRLRQCEWSGQNLLGMALMDVRNKLRQL